MLKELQDIINKDTLMDGVDFGEGEPIFGRGSEIIEQAKHAIVYVTTFEPERIGNITMFINLIEDIEGGGHNDDYMRIDYDPVGAFVISDAMGGENA